MIDPLLNQKNPSMKSYVPPFDTWSILPERTSFTSSIASKATPLALKSWVTLSLTLDGRDKITKLIQYTSRLLGYYFEVLAVSCSSSAVLKINDTSHHSNDVIKWMEKAQRFRNLQKALTQSRKAYRFGRSLAEVQKLREMGILHWALLYLRQFILRDPSNSCQSNDEKDNDDDQQLRPQGRHQINSCLGNEDTKVVQTISTYKAQDLNTECNDEDTLIHNSTDERKTKITEDNLEKQNDGSNHASSSKTYHPSLSLNKNGPQPPMWKIVFGAIKLVGLAGFWAADNVSYLYGTGFWVDDKIDHFTTTGERNQIIHKPVKDVATVLATQSYFVAALAGLYLNTREWLSYRNGPLREAVERVSEIEIRKSFSSERTENSDKDNVTKEEYPNQETSELLRQLEDVQRKHFVLCLSLLKSVCDIIAFSNNPGVDLHKKYRGRKMNEGIQCVCGIASALTVLYTKFPNATSVNA